MDDQTAPVPGQSYALDPEALRAATGNVAGTLTQSMSAVLDLARLVVAPTSFAEIGSAVSAQNTVMQGHQVSAVQSLLRLLQDVTDLVQKADQDYQDADHATATGYGSASGTGSTASAGLWTSPVAARVADVAATDSPPRPGDPQSVGTVLSYLQHARSGQAPATVPPHPTAFADWLDSSTAHQQQLGVVGVYSGQVRTLADVPGGVHRGDIVVVQSAPDPTSSSLGVAGTAGALYNHGVVSPDFSAGATVRVYRPISA